MDFRLNKNIWALPVDKHLLFFGNIFIYDGVDIDIGIKYSFEGASDFDEKSVWS